MNNVYWAARAGAAPPASISVGALAASAFGVPGFAAPAFAAGAGGAASVSGRTVRLTAGGKVTTSVLITRQGNVVTIGDRLKVRAESASMTNVT